MNLSVSLPTPGAAGQRNLELAIPVVSLGFTLAGILLWQAGIRIDIQYFAAGCLISSCILAYLAFIRPRKDIVALSTPLYAFIFFVVPTDYEAGVILQILYGISITILLVRLKYRFGARAPEKGPGTEDGPLGDYLGTVRQLLPPMDRATAADAAAVFIRFAEGEYPMAARFAERRLKELDDPASDPVAAAFAIVAEQASHPATGISVPETFATFTPDQQAFLFHHAGTDQEPEDLYAASLDNALLLLYAAARYGPGSAENQQIAAFKPFAARLSAKP